MACFKSLSFCLVTAFLFFSCVLFSFSLGEQARLPATSGKYGEKNSGMVFSWGRIERFLAESDEPPVNSTLVLAAKRTYRKDPLNNFEKYRGGWNISEGHYWASVAFTAAPFFVIAAAWFLLFALCLLIICLRHCCCRKEPYGYSRIAYALSLILLILFTIAAMYFLHTDTDIYKYIKFAVGSATYCLNSWSLTFKKEQVGIQPVLHDRNNPIYVKWPSNLCMYNFLKLGFASQHGFMTIYLNIGCVVLYTGQGKYHSSTANTLDYVVHQANITSEKLRNVSEYLSAAKKVGVNQMFLPSNVQSDIDRIQTKINSSASTLATTAEDNSNDIKNLIDSVRLALIILSAIMLILTFLGFVFSLFGMQFLVYILVILGWILVTGTFILCGIFLLLHNVTADTCVAMDQWVQNPTAHTALDDILPCVDNATAQETLTRAKEVTSQLANIMNFVVNNVSNINFPPNVPTLYFNQSGPLLPSLCNPFNPDLTDRTCQPGEVDLENATQVWNNYVCDVSPNGICFTTGRLTPRFYSQMAAGVNISYGLYKYGPFLVDLQDCTFVRQTFTDIDQTYCPGLRRYSSWIYIGLVMVATAVMLSLLFWVIYGRERIHRVYTKEHKPRFTEGYEGGKP